MQKTFTILVVEDSPFFRKVLDEELKEIEFDPIFAETGEEGIEKFKQRTDISLVVLDLELPQKNGFEVLQDLKVIMRERGVDVPVIFLTAKDTMENRKRGFELGAMDFLGKSRLEGSLILTMRKILEPNDSYKEMNVLVLDDSALVRGIIAKTLMEEGINVYEASKPSEAYELLNDTISIDMMIVDKELPESDGLDFVRYVRKHYPNRELPILVVSGYPIKDVSIEFFEAGASDYLSKPFIKEEFVARVKSKLDAYLMDRVLRESAQREKELNQFKDKFFAQCSHDMKNPLSVIKLSLTVMKDDDNLTEKQKKRMNLMEAAADKLLNLISSLLELRKVELESTLKLKKLNLDDEIKVAISEISPIAQNKGIKINVNFNENLPVCADEFAVHRIFTNLLSNAIKFSKENSEININAEKQEEKIIVSVQDYGVGMSKEKQKFIFCDEFLKSSKGTGGEIGSGLGLSICRTLCEKQKATIAVKSEEGKGTCFITTWPKY